jgi:uncharacterized protein YjlB
MSIFENAKRAVENATGLGKPSAAQLRAALQNVRPQPTFFRDDGFTPNNQRFPFLVYPAVVKLDEAADPAAVFEALFEQNRWGRSWRNGIYDYLHYHSMVHEVLGIARGSARVRFGGDQGNDLAVKVGDAVVLPAGTGHQLLEQSRDFLVVGAYPPEGEYDEGRGRAEEHARAVQTIANTPIPETDPLFGQKGPLLALWTS